MTPNVLEKRWFEDWNNILQLAHELDKAYMFPETRDVIYFFEKPWKWSPEWEHFQAWGSLATYNENDE